MELEMVFNELSQKIAPDIATARQWMSSLIGTMREGKKCGLKGLRTHINVHTIFLAENYPLAQWRNDNEVTKEEQTFWRTLTTKTPLSVDIVDPDIKNTIENEDYECSFEGKKVAGLKTAYLLETLAISLNSESCWDSSVIELQLIQLENNELIEQNIAVQHASCKIHVIEQADWIKHRLQTNRLNGIQLSNCREELFPSLQFCDSANRQLRKLRTGEERLEFVREALFEVEDCAQKWKNGSIKHFKLDSLEESRESQVTINKYGEERTFVCPDGEKRLFDRHIKLRSCNWRIHYFLEEKTKIVIIGYIGHHLPTEKYPT